MIEIFGSERHQGQGVFWNIYTYTSLIHPILWYIGVEVEVVVGGGGVG